MSLVEMKSIISARVKELNDQEFNALMKYEATDDLRLKRLYSATMKTARQAKEVNEKILENINVGKQQ